MKVLVVSRDDHVAQRIHAALGRWAWDCEQTSENDRQQLAALVSRSAPHLVIVVWNPEWMPEEEIRQLRHAVRGKLVVAGPADSGRILYLLHQCGVDEYLDLDDLENEIEAFIRRSSDGVTGKVVAILSPSGGGGSSTVTANLATALAKRDLRCVAIDLNFSTGDIAPLLNLKPKHTIADLARNHKRVDAAMFSQMLTVDENGVALLAAPADVDEVSLVTRDGVSAAIRLARNLFPLVLVDVEGSLNQEQITALELADQILIVFQMDFCSLRNVSRVLDYFWRHGVDPSCVRLVANRFGQYGELSRSQVESALNMQISFTISDDRKTVASSANTGTPFVISNPRAGVSKEIGRLAADLDGTVK